MKENTFLTRTIAITVGFIGASVITLSVAYYFGNLNARVVFGAMTAGILLGYLGSSRIPDAARVAWLRLATGLAPAGGVRYQELQNGLMYPLAFIYLMSMMLLIFGGRQGRIVFYSIIFGAIIGIATQFLIFGLTKKALLSE